MLETISIPAFSRARRLALLVGLGVLAALVVFLVGGAGGPVAAAPAEAALVVVPMTRTVFLPFIANYQDPAYVSPFAISLYGDINDAAGATLMRAAGSQWAVTTLSWATIEPQSGQRNWTGFDQKMNDARVVGMDVCVQFRDNPAWAAQYAGGPVTNTQTLVSFVAAMAERYDADGNQDAPGQPVVNCYSLYNEPDNADAGYGSVGYWGMWGNDGAGYAAMVAQVAPAIHAANPRAKVLSGGIAYDWFTTDASPGVFVRSFLTDTLKALRDNHGGVAQYLDGIDFHYYPISSARWPNLRAKAAEIQRILAQFGAGALPLYMSEMGFWSATEAGSSELRQAEALAQMYVHGLSMGIRQMAWYTVFDSPGLPTVPTEVHGLFRYSDLNSPKPAYTAYKTLTSQLIGARYTSVLAATGAEGYVFALPSGRSKTVVWGTAVTATVPFTGTCLRVVDVLGPVTQVADGGATDQDHLANGRVSILVPPDHPVYVEMCY